MKTEAAQAAAMIRKELKKQGIECNVKSKNFTGGDSVSVTVYDQSDAAMNKIKKYCGQFEAGRFCHYSDMYEYSNDRSDVPQAKYVSVRNAISDELYNEMYLYFKSFYRSWKDFPETYQEARKIQIKPEHFESVEMYVQNSWHQKDFWKSKRPRIRLTAA